VRARRFLVLALVIAAAPLLAACGEHTLHHADANNNGTFINAGPVTYQLEVSRELNQYSSEDSGYITGLPKSAAKLAPNQEWFGVFLWAKNESKRTVTTGDRFDIVDTLGNTYRPLPLNPSRNPYAWTPQALAPGATEPNPTTTAGYGPTGGRLLLFKLPAYGNNSIYDNRPLTLQIRNPSGTRVWGTISLDL
jgi:hypothetical protein